MSVVGASVNKERTLLGIKASDLSQLSTWLICNIKVIVAGCDGKGYLRWLTTVFRRKIKILKSEIKATGCLLWSAF